MIKTVSQEWADRLEALQYEVFARGDIISRMIANNFSTNTDSYDRYHKEYMEFYRQYEEAKEEFAKEYIYTETNGKKVDWNLDFSTLEVTFNK